MLALLGLLQFAAAANIVPSTYTVPGAFPTSVFTAYYNNPTATAGQVQPVIEDPVLNKTYPLNLTAPDTIPTENLDPHPLPSKASDDLLLQLALGQLSSVANSSALNDTCAKCVAGLEVAKFLALAAPEQGPELAVGACKLFDYDDDASCEITYSRQGLGNILTQVIANADAASLDGQMLCYTFLGLCPIAPVPELDLSTWFTKPQKPDPLPFKQRSGERLKVLHLSDVHLDARYATGAEANCTSGICCRTNNHNTNFPEEVLVPAPRFGHYLCDTPESLMISAMEAIPLLTDTVDTGFAFSIYTGDLVSHDNDQQGSRDYSTYTETVIFDLFRRMLGSGPVYATMGNHDSYNSDQDAPHSIGGDLAEQFQWNYDHLASLWAHEEWLPDAAVELARSNYGGYMAKRADGLRVIALNTNLWYRHNYFNYINMTHPDTSGILRFLTDELQEAEDAGDRVWIIGHVGSGWDGTNALPGPTNLFYQIVDRFSPHVIANIFWAHTHEDQLSLYYANNATEMSAETAQAMAWIGPSITSRTRVNAGFRVYEVDSATFEVMDSHTWFSNVSMYGDLDSQVEVGPTFQYEYSARKVYGSYVDGWGAEDPLNATWWHKVTEAMEADHSLVSTFNTLQGKSSPMSPNCTSDKCAEAKVCYLRSGSSPIGLQCVQGYGSVQSAYSGPG
ncbi:Metallo-dependent phosphatase-like protein [Schizophyllum amplum]|uniref:Sphingomyelin phosphodiesterase n=1 Tax=Schizophyllum amplum TaxID=97359 RepID=A0A550D0B6_9AGAR|nr:Metallo-dependent phosphatase-like protein [Auriculariopsis ampla]